MPAPQVARVGQEHRQEQRPVFRGRARAQVGEVPREVRPLIDLQQQFGDLEVRHQAVDLLLEPLGHLRHALGEGLDLQQRIGDRGIGQFAGGGQPVDFPQLRGEQRQPLAPIAVASGRDGNGQFPLRTQGGKAGLWQQVGREVLELARTRYPHVAGA